MNPWTLSALDVACALVAGVGLVLILQASIARRPSFADRVAQGRVQERPPSAAAAWGATRVHLVSGISRFHQRIGGPQTRAGRHEHGRVALQASSGRLWRCRPRRGMRPRRGAPRILPTRIPHSPVRMRPCRHPPRGRRDGPLPHRARSGPPTRD